jgi:toxin ParE1/3/4
MGATSRTGLRITWTTLALQMLASTGQFIAKDNPKAATKLLKQIKKSAKLLQTHPFMGRRTEFEGIRELVVHPNYIVSYRVNADTVQILQVWHVAQNRYH